MKCFFEEKNDIEGYHESLLSLKKILEPKTFNFMLNESLHDSVINNITTVNNYDENKHNTGKDSIVSVSAHLKHWNEHEHELLWENVTVYLLDFDISRNKIAESNQILFDRGLDEWSHDELLLIKDSYLRHEMFLFSQTTIIIECSKFSINQID
ncbi:MAG: hypothetical protein ABS911_14410 [Carnobacterium sp.]|uniref:hypothetical protein n=1 Tax=Carnobacterium sp. TaxID=48221 RepID=UPI003314D5DA